MYIGSRIDDAAVFINIEMDVWTSGATCRSYERDILAFTDHIANVHKKLLSMSISSSKSTTMIHFNHQTIA
jgi:hypothetical protein